MIISGRFMVLFYIILVVCREIYFLFCASLNLLFKIQVSRSRQARMLLRLSAIDLYFVVYWPVWG